ncbi:MAG: hypothetical protein Kow001_05910 [Acidobacteriota bacterium]
MMYWRRTAIGLGLLLFPGWLHPAAAAVDDRASPPYHNRALRQYFRDRLLGTALEGPWVDLAGRSAQDPDVERKIDLLIADFTERLIERMTAVNRRLAEVEFQRHQLMPGLRRGEASSLWGFRINLNELRKAVTDLRSQLAPVFPQEASTCGFRPSVGESDLAAGFEKQMNLLRAELGRGERLIHDFMIKPTFTVSLNDLQGPGMLVSLHRAERVAEAMMSFLTRKGTSTESKRR